MSDASARPQRSRTLSSQLKEYVNENDEMIRSAPGSALAPTTAQQCINLLQIYGDQTLPEDLIRISLSDSAGGDTEFEFQNHDFCDSCFLGGSLLCCDRFAPFFFFLFWFRACFFFFLFLSSS